MLLTSSTRAPVSICLFGPVRISVHGNTPSHLSRPGAQWLLALLVLHRGSLLREEAAKWLHPDSESQPGRELLGKDAKALALALGKENSRLQRHLHSSLILDLENVWVDVLEFEGAIGRNDWTEAVTHHAAGATLLGTLPDQDIYPELFEHLQYHEGRLEKFYAHALAGVAAEAAGRGKWDEAEGLAKRALELQETDIPSHHILLRAAAARNQPQELEQRLDDLRAVCKGVRAVSLESMELYQTLREEIALRETNPGPRAPMAHPSTGAARTPGFVLPSEELFGRADDLRKVRALLYESQVVTLRGTAGVGKTWLAERVYETVAANYQDGAVFVDLTPLPKDGAALIPEVIAEHFRLGQAQEEVLLCHLEGRDTLLVLNNCEHLLTGCAAFVRVLCRRCPKVRVLATSRHRLKVPQEREWEVRPLPLPAGDVLAGITPQALLASPAIALFVRRVVNKERDFSLTPENMGAVARICTRLGGIPLALVMAAARTRPGNVREIAERLTGFGRFELLTEDAGDDVRQHETLLASLDWSYDLLPSDNLERRLFNALSVFADGWNSQAAEAVSGLGRKAFGTQEKLIDYALVDGSRQDGRLCLLETMREYSRRKLEASPEAPDVHRRFLAWCETLVYEAAQELDGPEQKRWLGVLEAEHSNLRAALRYCQEEARWAEGVRLAARLWPFWNTRNHWREGRGWLELFLANPAGGPEDRASACNGAALLAIQMGDFEQALAHLRKGRAIAEGLGPKILADVLSTLGFLMVKRGVPEEIPPEAQGASLIALYHRAMREQPEEAIHADRSTFWPLWGLGKEAMERDEPGEAESRFLSALEVARRHGNLQHQILVLGTLAKIARGWKLWPQAATHLTESLRLAQSLEDLGSVAACLEDFARMAVDCAAWEEAVRCCAVAKVARELAAVMDDDSRRDYPLITDPSRRHMDGVAYEAAWAAGRGLTRAELLRFIPTPVA